MWIYTSTPPYAFMTLSTGTTLPFLLPIASFKKSSYLNIPMKPLNSKLAVKYPKDPGIVEDNTGVVVKCVLFLCALQWRILVGPRVKWHDLVNNGLLDDVVSFKIIIESFTWKDNWKHCTEYLNTNQTKVSVTCTRRRFHGVGSQNGADTKFEDRFCL
jgi:hypothetical protein